MRSFSWIEAAAKATVKAGVRPLLLVLLLGSLGIAQTSPVPQIANPLVPTAVVPGSASFTLTVSGTGFVPGSTVYWNGSPRTTTYVSVAQLKATINASDVATATSGSVTVHNPEGRVSNPALLLVTNSVTSLAFGSAEITGYATDVLAGDFNNDGNPDVALNYRSGVQVALGNSDGSLNPAILYSLPSTATGSGLGTVLGDFNHDGFVDVAVGGYTPAASQVFLNNGNGTFQSPLQNLVSVIYEDAAAGDLNGDGNLDIVFTARFAVAVALGNGDGTFQPPIEFALPNDAYSVALGDFNRDGILDIAASIFDYGGISVLFGRGDGTFDAQTNYDFGQQTRNLITADLNGDGYPDIIGTDINVNTFYVLLNAGDGTFLPSVKYQGTNPFSYLDGVVAGDINGDGKVDIVLQNPTGLTDAIQVLSGNGDGTLQAAVAYGIRQDRGSGEGGRLSLNDFNHDGKLDVATTSANGGYLMLQTAGPEPTISPGSLTFAPQAVGSESLSQTLTLLQPGSTVITINSITASGDFQTDGGCVGYVLNPGNNYCLFSVYFLPTDTGVRTGSLTINSSGGTQRVVLTGTGTPAINISISPSSLTFATQELNSTSFNLNVTLTNTGSQTLNLNSITLSGANAGDFLATNLCGSTIGVGASCTVQVAFRPSASGLRTASLNISDNAANSPQSVPLSGTGTALHVSTNLLDFGNVTVGTSNSLTLTLRNLGFRTISVAKIKISGGSGSNYSQTNTCASGIPPRSNCTFTVTFTPQRQGQLNAVLSFTANGSGTQAVSTVSLRGRGQ